MLLKNFLLGICNIFSFSWLLCKKSSKGSYQAGVNRDFENLGKDLSKKLVGYVSLAKSEVKLENNKDSFKNKLVEVKLKFPDPYVLQELEYASEGAANKVLDLLAKEQEYRIEKEQEYMKHSFKMRRLGQIYGFIIILAIIISSVILSLNNYEDAAIYLSVSGFCSMAFATIFSIFYLDRKKHLFKLSKKNKSFENSNSKKNTINSNPNPKNFSKRYTSKAKNS